MPIKKAERRRKEIDRLRATGEEFLLALAEYDRSGDHLKHAHGADCMRCQLLARIVREAAWDP